MTISIPMIDPAAEYRAQQTEIDAAIHRVLASGRFVLGPEGEALEREVAAYVGVPHAVGCNSGTDALLLALVAAGVGAGDEVVVPAFTFFATAEAVSHTGATPVFADIDPATFNLSAPALEACVTARTRAVIAVHLFGQCAALDAISAVCRKHKLLLVEDCAQALGADYQGLRAGAWGDFGCFSFYPTKNLSATGDAGMITTREEPYAQRLRMLRHHGSDRTYVHEHLGWNSRLDELQAAVLRVKLTRLERYNDTRRRLAHCYRQGLQGLALNLPYEDPRGRHVYHQFTLRSDQRDAIRAALARAGVASSIYYPIPLHRQPVYALRRPPPSLPESDAAARSVLSLPIGPLLDEASIERICALVRAALT